jgi:predicted MPP superfamily phosphohydrolase
VIQWAEEIEPDVIVLTGDLVETRGGKETALAFVERLPKTKMFSVMGNWDYWTGIDPADWKRKLGEQGATLLVNECVGLSVKGEKLAVAGIDDPWAGNADLDGALEKCPPGYRILLSHEPAIFEEPQASQFPLILAGHCHGGQVQLPFLGPIWLPRGCPRPYSYGLFEKNGTQMYVTSGVGTSILPIRFFSRPEVVLLRLTKSSDKT